jgi:DNA-binding phage protein
MLHSSSVISFSKVRTLEVEQQSLREQIRSWLHAILAERNLSPIALAKLVGVSPTTIYRAMDVDGEFTPTTKTIEKIASKTGKAPPSMSSIEHYHPLKAEHIRPFGGLEAVDIPNGLIMSAELHRQFLAYRVLDRALELEGYLPGDIVLVDETVAPKAGDIVCADLLPGRPEGGGTILRLFEPPYLMARSHDRRSEPLPILLDRSVAIRGTATRMFREMRKAS